MLASLLYGIGPIGVASNRVVWVSFAGGNLTDWQLWTATTTHTQAPSTVVDATDDAAPVVLREGPLSAADLGIEVAG